MRTQVLRRIRWAVPVLLLVPLVGCHTTSLKSQLDWYKAERERLVGDLNRMEHELNVCHGEQDGLRQQLLTMSDKLRLSEEDNSNLRVANAEHAAAAVTPAIEDGAEDAFREVDGVEVDRGDEGEIVLTLEQAILFPSGSAKVTREGRATMARLTSILSRDFSGRRVRVEGHTDNTPVRKIKDRYPSNWELSSARASAVLRELLRSKSVRPELCSVVGLADQRPVADNSTKSGQRQNRRVEIVILP